MWRAVTLTAQAAARLPWGRGGVGPRRRTVGIRKTVFGMCVCSSKLRNPAFFVIVFVRVQHCGRELVAGMMGDGHIYVQLQGPCRRLCRPPPLPRWCVESVGRTTRASVSVYPSATTTTTAVPASPPPLLTLLAMLQHRVLRQTTRRDSQNRRRAAVGAPEGRHPCSPLVACWPCSGAGLSAAPRSGVRCSLPRQRQIALRPQTSSGCASRPGSRRWRPVAHTLGLRTPLEQPQQLAPHSRQSPPPPPRSLLLCCPQGAQ